MRIHSDFIGGNIQVLKVEETEIYVKNEIRDTKENWFYWAFCVEGAQGTTKTFHFNKKWIGYYGPAISHDLKTWDWLGAEDETVVSDSFTYTFAEDEERVYFAHNMLYHPMHFHEFCRNTGLEIQTLCTSEAGNKVPCICTGSGSEVILLTARHHACEATGNYILEGVLEELHRNEIPGFQVIAVPFVDYDGVVKGDQGKARVPWDHNRDYDPEKDAIYASVREIRRIAAEKKIRYAFDFHSPWHNGGANDRVFIPQKSYSKNTIRFANLFEKIITPEAFPYFASGTFPPDVSWNRSGTPAFAAYMNETGGAELAFTLETPYFRAGDCMFSPQRARETGRCFARALRDYHSRSVKISFTGDLLYQMPMNDLCRTGDGYDFMPLLQTMWSRLSDTDYLIGNIESPVAGEELDGYTHEKYCFNSPDEVLQALKKSGFDMVSLANNHSMDRGQEGIAATLAACEREGLEHIGMYRTAEENDEVFVRNIGGIRVGFVNYTYGTNAFAHHRFLDEDKKYMVKMTQPEETLEGAIDLLKPLEKIEEATRKLYDPVSPVVAPYLEKLKWDIQRTKEQSDYVVMLLHSGGQYNIEPDAYTKMLADKIWEYGADVIIGNHPHIILPSAYENGRFTAYCLGNLISARSGPSDCPVDANFSAVVNLILEKKGGEIEQHITFRLCQTIRDTEGKVVPYTVDTYDYWKEHPTEEYHRLILEYANRFMPGMNYAEPQAEYRIC